MRQRDLIRKYKKYSLEEIRVERIRIVNRRRKLDEIELESRKMEFRLIGINHEKEDIKHMQNSIISKEKSLQREFGKLCSELAPIEI